MEIIIKWFTIHNIWSTTFHIIDSNGMVTICQKLFRNVWELCLDEVVEAQQTAEVARLSSSPAGRRVLEALCCNPTAIRER
ncbi:hypothetical protein MTO96_023730 [Rhipicephalus appendiculatus]